MVPRIMSNIRQCIWKPQWIGDSIRSFFLQKQVQKISYLPYLMARYSRLMSKHQRFRAGENRIAPHLCNTMVLPRTVYTGNREKESNLPSVSIPARSLYSISLPVFMKLFCLSIATILLVTSADAKSASPQMEHNAFLRKPVFSAKALAQQVGSDPTVLKRYERHFMLNKDVLKEYFTKLELVPLRETRRYLVYNVDANFKIKKKMLILQKGTLVFADKTGKPVLKRTCGNPMVAYLPPKGQIAAKFIPPKYAISGIDAVESPIVYAMASEPEPSVEPTVTPIENPAPTPVATPLADPLPPALPALPGAFGPSLPWLPIVILPFLPGGDKPTDPPVPEPMSIAVLGMGVSSLLMRRRSRPK